MVYIQTRINLPKLKWTVDIKPLKKDHQLKILESCCMAEVHIFQDVSAMACVNLCATPYNFLHFGFFHFVANMDKPKEVSGFLWPFAGKCHTATKHSLCLYPPLLSEAGARSSEAEHSNKRWSFSKISLSRFSAFLVCHKELISFPRLIKMKSHPLQDLKVRLSLVFSSNIDGLYEKKLSQFLAAKNDHNIRI